MRGLRCELLQTPWIVRAGYAFRCWLYESERQGRHIHVFAL